MASTAVTQWPSQTWTRYQAEVTANQIPAQARTPTWPAHLEPPHSDSAHPQPNVSLQLTQVLEWEIWNHDQTRASLRAEQHCSEDLEGHIWKLEQDIAQWQQACHTISVALGEHRSEHANLQKDLDGMANELEYLRRLQPASQVSWASNVVPMYSLLTSAIGESDRARDLCPRCSRFAESCRDGREGTAKF